MSKLVVLILRDAKRLQNLHNAIHDVDGRTIFLPVFTYEPILDCKPALEFLRSPQKFHRVFFAGSNGVDAICAIADHNRLDLPIHATCAAPGQATLKLLVANGFKKVIAPSGVGSFETLLKLKAIGNLRKHKVGLIQRLDAPKQASGLLRTKQSEVTEIDCYKRITNANGWQNLNKNLRQQINCIVAFDAPSLMTLAKTASQDYQHISQLPVCVIHPNIKAKAVNIGYQNIIVENQIGKMICRLQKLVINQ